MHLWQLQGVDKIHKSPTVNTENFPTYSILLIDWWELEVVEGGSFPLVAVDVVPDGHTTARGVAGGEARLTVLRIKLWKEQGKKV